MPPPDQAPPHPDPGREPRRPVPFRPYFVAVTGLLTLGGAGMTLALTLGFSEASAVRYFIAAACLGLLGTLAWLAVVHGQSRAGTRALAWVAFPIALFSLVGMLPLLVVAAFPEMLGALAAPDRLDARVEGNLLRIEFPRRMDPQALNLTFGDTTAPPGYFRTHPGRARWQHLDGPRPRSYLFLDLEGIRRDLELGPVHRVGVNQALGVDQVLDESGKRFQPQWVPVPEPAR